MDTNMKIAQTFDCKVVGNGFYCRRKIKMVFGVSFSHHNILFKLVRHIDADAKLKLNEAVPHLHVSATHSAHG